MIGGAAVAEPRIDNAEAADDDKIDPRWCAGPSFCPTASITPGAASRRPISGSVTSLFRSPSRIDGDDKARYRLMASRNSLLADGVAATGDVGQ